MTAPLLAGAIAEIAGGDAGWRWAFVILGVVSLPAALSATRIREPRRGRHEMQSVLGEELAPEANELPISLSVAFERLRLIRSFYYFLVGMAALGLALFTTPLFLNLYFKDQLGLDAFRTRLGGDVCRDPLIGGDRDLGRRADALFRRSPPLAMAFVGLLVALFGGGLVLAIWMPNIWSVVPVLALATGMRAGGLHDPAGSCLDHHPVPVARAWDGDDRDLHLPLRRVLRVGARRDPRAMRSGRGPALTILVLPSTLIGGGAHLVRRSPYPPRHDDGGGGAEGRAG